MLNKICKKSCRQWNSKAFFSKVGTAEISVQQEKPTVYLRYDSSEGQQEKPTVYLRYDSSEILCEDNLRRPSERVKKNEKSIGVAYMITAKMRSTLNQQLQFSYEDISQMTPQFAAEIIGVEWKKELGTSEDDMRCLRDFYYKNNRLPCGSIEYKVEEHFEIFDGKEQDNRDTEKSTSSSILTESTVNKLYLLN